MQAVPNVLFTRPEHGLLAVRSFPDRFELDLGDSLPSPAVYQRTTQERALLAAIMGKVTPGASVNRYFRLNRRSRAEMVPVGGSILDLWAPPPPVLTVMPARVATARQRALTVAPSSLGIDLAKRGGEVRKILFAGFGAWMARSGYDPEDVLQDVFRGILARNEGKCPFDAKKSSFGHYVHMICNCVLSNYHRREQRRREHEQVGIRPSRSRDADDQYGGLDDAAVEAERRPSTLDLAPDRDIGLERALALLPDEQTRQVALLLATGLCRREVAERLNVAPRVVDRAVKMAREALSDL